MRAFMEPYRVGLINNLCRRAASEVRFVRLAHRVNSNADAAAENVIFISTTFHVWRVAKRCQDHFGFDLPSVSWSKRLKKFEAKFSSIC